HCLIDGMSGVDLGTVLLDLERDPPPAPPAPEWSPEPAPTPAQLLRDAWLERLTHPGEVMRSVQDAAEKGWAASEKARELAKGLPQPERVLGSIGARRMDALERANPGLGDRGQPAGRRGRGREEARRGPGPHCGHKRTEAARRRLFLGETRRIRTADGARARE